MMDLYLENNEELSLENYYDHIYGIDESIGDSSLRNNIFMCIISSIKQVYMKLMIQVFLCMALNLLPNKIFFRIKGLLSISCGISLLYVYFSQDTLYIITYIIVIAVCLTFYKKEFSWKLTCVFSLFYCLTGQHYMYTSEIWDKVRGVLMIIIMKTISIAFDGCDERDKLYHSYKKNENKDEEISNSKKGTILLMIQYLLDPFSIIFGPWQSFSQFLKAKNFYPQDRKVKNLSVICYQWQKLYALVYPMSLAMCFFLVSSCLELILLYGLDVPLFQKRWPSAYIQAFSFRAGHYFVSYFSETLSNLTATVPSEILHVVGDERKLESEVGPVHVTRFSKIEFPRSLVDVCYYWNLPMSRWLNLYVFRKSKLYVGTFSGLLLTYLVSSLLHGFNFRISVILLSLAFYTYVEYELRRLLSHSFNACVGAKKCRSGPDTSDNKSHPCPLHTYTETNWIVKLVNVSFSLLAIFHLTYLGAPFGITHEGGNGGALYTTLDRWSQLNYLSHAVVAVTFLLTLILKATCPPHRLPAS